MSSQTSCNRSRYATCVRDRSRNAAMHHVANKHLSKGPCTHLGRQHTAPRSLAARCKAAAATTADEQASIIQQLLTRRSYAPPRFVGPIQVSEVSGKRYGLVATQNLPMGALLLVVPALAVAFGPSGAAPSNAELVEQLDGQQLDPLPLQWLRLLYRQPAPAAEAAVGASDNTAAAAAGTADVIADDYPTGQQQQLHSPADASSSSELAVLQELLLHGQAMNQDSENTAATNPTVTTSVSIASVSCPFTTQQLEQVIAENAYSEPSEDLGAALLRELDPEGITGFWPEYALLNHSCAPNTVAVVVGQYLLLRAVQPVLQGEELTGSYLGALGFSPVAIRRAYLSGVYGFHCQCGRCMTEQSTFPTTYYPADNSLLGIVDPAKLQSKSSGDAQQGQQRENSLLSKVLGVLGFGGSSSSSSKGKQQPRPSQQHTLLLQLHTETADLAATVQEAVISDSRRSDRQLALLMQITERIDTVLTAVNDVLPQLQASAFVQSVQTASRWLVAAVYPLLQLQVELLELLLSSGELPVDDNYLLHDNVTTRGGTGSALGGSNQTMVTAGAAAAARLSLSRGSKSNKSNKGFGSVLAGWGLRPDDDVGPVTKRQLLGLYVEALERSLQVVDSVGRGSEVHVVVALKHMDAARQFYGADSAETRLAESLCSRAHAARYGVMKGDKQRVLAALISARRRQLLGVSLARKMSVLAWEDATARS